MRLIVGLGNPGKEYLNTRHNIGFMVIDSYLSSKEKGILWRRKFDGLYVELTINGEKVLFLKPQKFINLSGEVIKAYIDFFKIKVEDILIISDDMDLSVGNFKLKEHGSSGGHNGLKNIELCLSTSNYKRLKVGISRNNTIDNRNYVLGKITDEDMKIYNVLFLKLADVFDDYFYLDFSKLMNKYNQKNRS